MAEPGKTPTIDDLVDEALPLGEGLGRPLRYVQINSFYNGSTGAIMKNLHKGLIERGVDSYMFWGRRHETISDHEQCCASKVGVYLHGALSRITDRAGFYSKRDTSKLLKRLDAIDPDVVHLHNIHGYYVNVEMLFEWLSTHDCLVRWTLHDCWAFTGHCPYFQYIGCERWMDGCYGCPQKRGYPASLLVDSSECNWRDKRRAFTRVSSERMTLISPSFWLAGLLENSFLNHYSVKVRYNTVDRSVFKPTQSDFRNRYGVGNRFVILGVASPWSERKGLGDFIRLASVLDDSFAIVLVGLSKKQTKALPKNILGLEQTSSAEELAGIYSAADVFFNPTKEDNFPTVNLEAEACGTPVVAYNVGGCAETLGSKYSVVIRNLSEAIDLFASCRAGRTG